jgi:hypothetical protein
MSNLVASEQLLELIFSAAEEGMNMLQQNALVPFALVMRKEGVSLQRFTAPDSDEALEKAEANLRESDAEVLGYALVYDATIEMENSEYDALLIEAAERGAENAYRFAQRYQPATVKMPPYTIGQVAYLGEAESFLRA